MYVRGKHQLRRVSVIPAFVNIVSVNNDKSKIYSY